MKLTAMYAPFTSFCEGPRNIEKGFKLFNLFHEKNLKKYMPQASNAKIVVVSSGPGYMQDSLQKWGYTCDVLGIDSNETHVRYAQGKGFNSLTGDCLEYLDSHKESYDVIIAEQEVNHLTRDEFLRFLTIAYDALRPEGILLLSAANCANPLIATEYLGNNIDHYLSLSPHGMRQYFQLSPFNHKKIIIFAHDFYVIWYNPFNYIAKALTGCLHLLLRGMFALYGKNNRIFTKRFGVVAVKETPRE